MLRLAKKVWGRVSQRRPVRGYSFSRPLVGIQSDDWGRVGVRDHQGAQQLRDSGVELGSHPYDSYTLETASDVNALREVLMRHRDSTGRAACIVMNFLSANLDFPRMAARGYKDVHLLPLKQGLPGNWERPGLFAAYREGVADGVFFPALHGLTHFCPVAVDHALTKGGERAETLHVYWRAETPYIYWRMPWVGYEYRNPGQPREGFLAPAQQEKLIGQAAGFFQDFFSTLPASACAPGYRANHETRRAWSKYGVRVAQNGASLGMPPAIDEYGMLNLYRTLDFEPCYHDAPLEESMKLASDNIVRGLPVIISVHSINFHSSLRDFRSRTLVLLDKFLTALEKRFPNLLYVHDANVYDLVHQGKYNSAQDTISVVVSEQELSR